MDGEAVKTAPEQPVNDDVELAESPSGEAVSDGMAAGEDTLAALEDEISFREQLEGAITVAYPELLRRVKSSLFADWHRKRGTEVELAHTAVAAAMISLLRRRQIPDDMLAYLVTTARRLAQKDWGRRPHDPLAGTAVDPTLVGGDGESPEDEVLRTSGDRRTTLRPSPTTPLGIFSSMADLRARCQVCRNSAAGRVGRHERSNRRSIPPATASV